jgi:hypothetical protein
MKISIADPGYAGLSDYPYPEKYDVSGLFYENEESDNPKRLLINHA